jgi:CheY-like chemotaxis protein
MAKIMLVEDDNNLREIYEARLAAEGYEIVSAQDGEEALALAVKERPDLIIADIMMPKVSGFDMLDILRSTPETKHCKIIMMTALSQAEDKARAETLGADRYLVKSQVTLEDVVKVASEMLKDDSGTPPPTMPPTEENTSPIAPTPATTASAPVTTPPVEPVVTLPAPATTPTAIPVTSSDDDDAETSLPTPQDNTTGEIADEPVSSVPETNEVKEELSPGEPITPAAPVDEAQASEQIEDFIKQNPTVSTSAEPEKDEPKTEPATTAPEFTEEVIGSNQPPTPVSPEAATPARTSITVTQADDEEEPVAEKAEAASTIPLVETTSTEDAAEEKSDADQTLERAVDSLVPSADQEEKPAIESKVLPSQQEDQARETKQNEESDAPQLAKKRGGERVIEPMPSTEEKKLTGEELVALANAEAGVSTPPPGAQASTNSVVTPQAPQTAGFQPGQIIQANPSTDNPPADPTHLAL